MSIPLLVLELWQSSFKNWNLLLKSGNRKYALSDFCPMSGNRSELAIPNLAWMFLIKWYWMFRIARVTVFIVSELLRENQTRGGGRGGGEIFYCLLKDKSFNWAKKQNYISDSLTPRCNILSLSIERVAEVDLELLQDPRWSALW